MRALIIALFLLVISLPAHADQKRIRSALDINFTTASHAPCVDRRELLVEAKEKYSEEPVGMGLATDGNMIEILAAPNGNFTIVFTRPSDGKTCFIVAGEAWETLRKPSF